MKTMSKKIDSKELKKLNDTKQKQLKNKEVVKK